MATFLLLCTIINLIAILCETRNCLLLTGDVDLNFGPPKVDEYASRKKDILQELRSMKSDLSREICEVKTDTRRKMN